MASGSPVRVETLSELQIWIKGEFALIAQTQDTANKDMTNVRRTVHDLSNHMTVIMSLNLPEKLQSLQKADEEHQKSIEQFGLDAARRQSALAVLKVVYTVLGALVGCAITVGFELYRVLH